MPPGSVNKLTITNPLILYRSLIAAKRIEPDPAQHRLAIHLATLYQRLKDYHPDIDFKHRLKGLRSLIDHSKAPAGLEEEKKPHAREASDGRSPGWPNRKTDTNVTALIKQLTNHQAALEINSPQGLLVCGEVGTGKSLLIDLFAESLPTAKKRRWHFNTFMLEVFSKLESLRRSQADLSLQNYESSSEEYSLLRMARDLISTSPIIFIDEFQFPDRVSSKILSNLLLSFFHLGGVLIATSNRVPEELEKAAGSDFGSLSRARPKGWGGLFNTLANKIASNRSNGGDHGEYAPFSEVLKARCEVWQMEGRRDWRRRDESRRSSSDNGKDQISDAPFQMQPRLADSQVAQSRSRGCSGALEIARLEESKDPKTSEGSEQEYLHVIPFGAGVPETYQPWLDTEATILRKNGTGVGTAQEISWQQSEIYIYGRRLILPRQRNGVTKWKFNEICMKHLGMADYTSLASTFHTFILTEVPILTLLQKNEARRFITLLDALYEARCKLLIHAEAGPDDLFFPEDEASNQSSHNSNEQDVSVQSSDSVYAETFSDIYQDQTSPFRPNVTAYAPSASPPAYAAAPASIHASITSDQAKRRSILADEDSDFGPNHTIRGGRNDHTDELDFSRSGTFTGQDEMFAYKRARSRLWEMCSSRWWERQGEWWRPLPLDSRHWEGLRDRSSPTRALNSITLNGCQQELEKVFPHGASPFRTSHQPPPRLSWTHIWGMMTWGKKAGAWGKGPAGLADRKSTNQDGQVDKPTNPDS